MEHGWRREASWEACCRRAAARGKNSHLSISMTNIDNLPTQRIFATHRLGSILGWRVPWISAMRPLFLLLVTSLAMVNGCSAMIASYGKDLSGLKSKEEVHTKLGEPEKNGVEEDI